MPQTSLIFESEFQETKQTFRNFHGFENPPAGTMLKLEYIGSFVKWSLIWENCPDLENLIQGWMESKQKATQYAIQNGWTVYT